MWLVQGHTAYQWQHQDWKLGRALYIDTVLNNEATLGVGSQGKSGDLFRGIVQPPLLHPPPGMPCSGPAHPLACLEIAEWLPGRALEFTPSPRLFWGNGP